jgi:hypothetical protein
MVTPPQKGEIGKVTIRELEVVGSVIPELVSHLVSLLNYFLFFLLAGNMF